MFELHQIDARWDPVGLVQQFGGRDVQHHIVFHDNRVRFAGCDKRLPCVPMAEGAALVAL